VGALEFQDAKGDAVDVQHDVRPLGIFSRDRHLFGNGESVSVLVFPVNQPDGDVLLADIRLDLHPVP